MTRLIHGHELKVDNSEGLGKQGLVFLIKVSAHLIDIHSAFSLIHPRCAFPVGSSFWTVYFLYALLCLVLLPVSLC